MNKTEYNIQLQSIFNLATLVRRLKIKEVLEAMDRAETLGPILDPTLTQKAMPKLGWQKDTVRAALAFQQTIEEIIRREEGK